MPQKSDQSDDTQTVFSNTIQVAGSNTQNDQPNTTTQKDVSPSPAKLVDTSTGTQVPKKYGGRKIIATIFGIGLLVIGTASTIFLVGRQQLLTGRASDCSEYIFTVTREGTVSVRNGSSHSWTSQKADVFVNELLVETYDVPALEAASASTLGTVRVPMYDSFTWRVEGRSECISSGKFDSRTK